ncbi:MAG: response regulator [Pelagimonas sp.]|jgi:CheY-like chemotaxis protein|nr:response regulator [Pelagimonas sp.]
MSEKQIYIADDNLDFAGILAFIAKSEGWSVELCGNGRELFQKVSEAQGPAVAIIDINMPEMDGIEVIEKLIDVDRFLRIRFITGGETPPILAASMIANARNLSVGRNLYKPIPKADFVDVLREEEKNLSAEMQP